MQEDVITSQRWHLKEDGTKVSDADITANRIVCAGLKRHFSNIPIVSEENPAEENAIALKADERFDTDPLDNTSGYLEGRDGFSVNIGRIKNGVPVAGAIYFPAKEELYFTGDDGKAYLQKGESPPKEIHVKKGAIRDPIKIAVGYHEQNFEHLGDRQHETTQAAGQMRTCLVASGECDITGIQKGYGGGFESWDVAAPHAVLLAAGGDIVTNEKTLLRYGKDTTKLPDHIAGSKDALLTLGLAEKSLFKSGHNIT
jgi:3'(2'), 5'-bisphosphate nucleotidase